MSSFGAAVAVVTFDLDALHCAINADSVIETLRAVALGRIPGQPEFIAGVIDLRGAVVPVLDTRVRFGLPRKEIALSDRFIVAKTRAQTVALWVDAVGDLISLRSEDCVASEGLIVGARSLAGVARTPQGLITIHDLDEFLSEAESDALTLLGMGS